METQTAIFLSIALPAVGVVTNLFLKGSSNFRDTITFLIALGTFLITLIILKNESNKFGPNYMEFEIFPDIGIAFHVEPLGITFAILASGLWILTHLYAIGYMRKNQEKHHSRFFGCFCFAIASVMGICFSANLLTLFLFYELLTISTYPLVAHKGTTEAIKGARVYLGILMGTSICLFLIGIIWTHSISGTLDFSKGGILEEKVSNLMASVLLALFAFGIGKAALMPFHKWLPSAMVAPTPVSALLHAVAVVKAGVFSILKIGIYVFGLDFLTQSQASIWLIWIAGFSLIASSIIALTKDNLKARLAYSTVSQLSYITLGVALANSMSVLGGSLHLITHAMGKITLFMCAGSIYVASQKTKVSQLHGLGKNMPITFLAFFIGALSIIGLPPLGGSWSKWLLILGAADADQMLIIIVFLVSSLLNVAYLIPIIGIAFFLKSEQIETENKYADGSFFIWGPPALTAIGCILLFFYADLIKAFLEPLVGEYIGS